MGWQEDVAEVLQQLPASFTLKDVYRFAPQLHSLHPENRHIRDKVRQQLQLLRDEGKLQFLDDQGSYLRIAPDFPQTASSLGLERNVLTTRDDLARRIGMETSDALRRGIFKPAQGALRNHMFLFHDQSANPYGDVDEGDRIYYVGQGQTGDQTLTSFNKYLAEHLERGLKVHYFVQPADHPGKILYRGEVVVESTQRVLREKQGRSVLQFTLVPVTELTKEHPAVTFGDAYADMLEYDRPAGPLEQPRRQTLATRVARDAAFRRLVVQLYDFECAVCGVPLRREKFTELEAAHIWGVGESGPDEVRNGLSLCGRHHWAFDNGVFSLTDTHKLLWLINGPDPHGEVTPGERIHLPAQPGDYPHPRYLAFHRKKWNAA